MIQKMYTIKRSVKKQNQKHNSLYIFVVEVWKERQVNRRRALGPDEIPATFLQLLDDEKVPIITCFFNKVYINDEIPENWLQSIFVTILKTSNSKEYND